MARTSTDGLISLVRDKDQIAAIEALRKEAYEGASEFQIAGKEAWEWSEADANGQVLAVWDREGQALATMRGSFAPNRAEAQNQLECTVPLQPSWFPTLVLERAATKARIAQRGLNSLLRYVFIETAIQHRLGSIIGAVFEGAPRLGVLAELGYQFSLAERMWDRNFNKHTPVHIVALPRKELTMAHLKLRTRFEATIASFPYSGTPIQLPIIVQNDEARDVES
jgi:hypothetical protein